MLTVVAPAVGFLLRGGEFHAAIILYKVTFFLWKC